MIFIGELHKSFFDQSGIDPDVILEKKEYYHRSQNNGETEEFKLEYWWLAEIFYFQNHLHSRYKYNELVASFIKSNEWTKCFIAIPDSAEFVSLDEMQPYTSGLLTVDSNADLFAQHLQSANIVPKYPPVFAGKGAYRCNIRYQTNMCVGGFRFNGPLEQEDATYEALWLSLLATVNAVSNLSNDQIIKEFVEDA